MTITRLLYREFALLIRIGVSLYAGAAVFNYFFSIEPIYSILIIATVTAIHLGCILEARHKTGCDFNLYCECSHWYGLIVDGIVQNYERISRGMGIHIVLMGLIMLYICVPVYVITSLLTPALTEEELENMGWRPPLKAIINTKFNGLSDPRVMASGLFILMIVLYFILR